MSIPFYEGFFIILLSKCLHEANDLILKVQLIWMWSLTLCQQFYIMNVLYIKLANLTAKLILRLHKTYRTLRVNVWLTFIKLSSVNAVKSLYTPCTPQLEVESVPTQSFPVAEVLVHCFLKQPAPAEQVQHLATEFGCNILLFNTGILGESSSDKEFPVPLWEAERLELGNKL